MALGRGRLGRACWLLAFSWIASVGAQSSAAASTILACSDSPTESSSSSSSSCSSTTSVVTPSSSSTSAPVAAASSLSPTSTVATTTSETTSATAAATSASLTNAPGTIVVDAAGGAQFTAINPAISYAQTFAQPTVLVKPGTYYENVVVVGTAQVTIVGESPSSDDYSKNQVTISNSATPMSIGTNAVLGITWRNINFANTATGTAAAVSLRGAKNAFYNCQFISSGSTTITSTLGTALIANSYIEGTDKVFYGYLGLYVFNSTVTATAVSSTIIYSHGYSTPIQYSQTVLDSCSIIQKPGTTNNYVYLAGSNGNGAQVVFKYTSMASLIAPGGTRAVGVDGFFGEYATTGPGSYLHNTARADTWMTTSMLSNWTIDYVFANSFTGYSTSTTSWIDSKVRQAVAAADVVVSSSSTSPSSSSASSSSSSQVSVSLSLTTSATAMIESSSSGPLSINPLTSSGSSNTSSMIGTQSLSSSSPSTKSASVSSTTSAAPSSTCSLPASVPSTALVVGSAGSCGTYANLSMAIAALPSDSTTQYVYILAGTYTEQITGFSRVGRTIFRGESTNPLSQGSNVVTLQYSGSIISSAGGSEGYAVFRSTQYNAKKYSFYNINFINTAAITPSYVAIAMDIKAQQVGFYSCGFISGQGTFLANYGTFFLSGCRIEGSSDFVWGYGAAFISNSIIVSSRPGYSIAAQNYISTYPSQFVFDQCAFVPKTTTSMSQSTYLGRDYSTSARVAVTNSFLDGHIKPAGWYVAASTTNVTFTEFNNTGPGYVPASRIAQATIPTDDDSYSLSAVLGDVSWIDSSATVPFSGFPDSVFGNTTTATPTSTSSTSSFPSSTTTALAASSTFVVSLTPNGTEYGSVESAISALPNDGAEKVILIMPGTYTEQININRTGKVTLRGTTSFVNDFSQNNVTIQFSYGVSTSAGEDELTPVINSKKTDGSGLALYNINFVNTFTQTKNHAALAADFYGTNMAAYGCSFIGFQDTLLANTGTQLFSNCYIEGSVDFIWGFSQAYFHQCYIATNTPGASISAQSRASASALGGYVFDSCLVTYTSTYGSSFGLSFLGRPYSNYSVAVYKNSYIDKNINSAGWSVWQTSNPQTNHVMFGEYNNVGPSAWTATTTRASFATNLTDAQVAAYDLDKFLGSTAWIDMTAYNLVPSFSFSASGVNGTATSTNTTTSTPATANATSSRPVRAVLVSVNGSIANSFTNLTAALASLPSDTTSQTIFMYPGSYTEQVSVGRSGPVTIVGYQSGNVGQSYTGNQVTLTFARGLSVVAPVAAGHTDAETAVISTASTQISFYNIDFINTDNLDGAASSYVTLAASVYGDQIGFYGCSFIGWQDTLLTGNPSGYAYYESSYIEGAIDFIWGYSLSYFKGCTIGAKKAKSSITAQSRASSTAIGGYVFDQCLFTAAADATVDLTHLVYIGRPYSKYAKVIVKYSYLDSIIQPAGWKAWSTTDPRLDYVTFAEYENSGPGNWENNTAARVAFGNATLLTSDTYTLSSVMASTSWIDMTYWNSIVTPQPAVITSSSTTGNSTSPPTGACIVSQTAISGQTTYSTIAECIATLPSTSAIATVFIYPGTYNEQLTFNRSGETVFRGYADSPSHYSSNQVTITNSHGVDTQSDESNSDSATFYSRGKNVKFYNINMINAFGATNDYASLAFAVGNSGNASFYGCQMIGNQDTFDINAGNVFAYNSYIEGSVDFIWGAGSAYFLASTISPNINSISITADKRTASTSVGGFVFDQCTVTPSAAGALVAGMTGSISLGRPWNQYARVAYIKTYLDSCVGAAGWNQWSSSSPNTNGVFFGEYQNTGPGATSTSRVSFSHQMTDAEATEFEISSFFSSTSWVDFTALSISPFSVTPASPTVTITSTVTPTGSTPITTSTSTVSYVTTVLLSTSITTKNTTTVTLNEIVSTTVTLQGSPTTRIVTKTSKITGTTTVTPNPVTQVQTHTISDVYTATLTPEAVSHIVTSLSTETVLLTSTPKARTITVKSTSTIQQEITATAPQVKITQTSTSLTSNIKTLTPKDVTRTTTVLVTIPAGPTVTVAAKKASTSYVSFTSTVLKTTKVTTKLTCTPAAAKAKRGFEIEAYVENDLARRDSSSINSTLTATVTVYYTIPHTETDYYTSYIYKTSIFPGQTYTLTVSSTAVVSKTSTLPTSTSTYIVDIQGTSVATKSLEGYTTTETSFVTSTAKTETSILPGSTISSQTTTTIFKTTTSTLPASTYVGTKTSIKTLTAQTVLPTSTVTITRLETTKLELTSTLPATTQIITKTAVETEHSTTTLLIQTVVVTKTSESKVPTPTVTTTKTIVKSTTLKSTSYVRATVTSTPKGLPTCS
ncbi:pectin lyase fold/virulence factor [Halenospora varia]|nr:pectin lyase fold/virulence factor [Halenospora varia]